MKHSRADPYLMFAREGVRLAGMIILEMNDSLVVSTRKFVEKEEEQLKVFFPSRSRYLMKT